MSSLDVFIISFVSIVLYHCALSLLIFKERGSKKMGDVKKLFGVDAKKEQEGVWRDDIGGDIKIKIARIGNPNYQKRFQALTKPHRRALRSNRLSDDIAEKLLIQCLAETIVLDWENVEEKGKKIPYSLENAIKLLTDYPELRSTINDIANELEGYQAEEEEDAVENLKK